MSQFKDSPGYKLYTDSFTDGPQPGFDINDLPVFDPKDLQRRSLGREFNCYAFAVNNPEEGFLLPGHIAKVKTARGDNKIMTQFSVNWEDIEYRMQFGGHFPEMEEVIENALAGALSDGCLRFRAGENVPSGYYPAALIGFETYYGIDEKIPFAADMHFLSMYRDIGDDQSIEKGYVGWAQKPGKASVTRRDFNGTIIEDPRTATYRRPGRFYTFLAVPKDGIRL